MKNTITRVDALNIAINSIPMDIENPTEVVEVLTKIRDQIAKPRKTSDEAKAKAKDKRADARAELIAQVAPILRSIIDHDMTAKEIFAAAQDQLPEDFTASKVQNILIREMAPELVRTERKKGGDLYRLAD